MKKSLLLLGVLASLSLVMAGARADTVDAPVITAPSAGSLQPGHVTVSGTAPADSIVSVYDGRSFAVATNVAVDDAGNWSKAISLGGGRHSLTAKASLNGSTSAPSAADVFTVDATPPKVHIDLPAAYLGEGLFLPTGPVYINGEGSDDTLVDHIVVTYTNQVTGDVVVGEETNCDACPAPTAKWWSNGAAGPGTWEASAVAYDEVGNASAPATFDYIAPGFPSVPGIPSTPPVPSVPTDVPTALPS